MCKYKKRKIREHNKRSDKVKELNEVLSEIRDRFGMTNKELEIYAHEKYLEKLLMITNIKLLENDNLKSVLKLKKEVFEDINIEELFVESTKITTKFNFQYKGGSILITLLKATLEKNYIYYLEDLQLIKNINSWIEKNKSKLTMFKNE